MRAPIGAGRAPGKLAAIRRLFPLLSMAGLSVMGPFGIDQVNAQVAPPMSSQAAELDEFEQRVRDYLLKNPELIMEALQILQERQRAAEAENLKRTIAERGEEILNASRTSKLRSHIRRKHGLCRRLQTAVPSNRRPFENRRS